MAKDAKKADADGAVAGMTTEDVDVSSLRPHPRNYRDHPDDQVEHIIQSIREHGLYRNIVIARDGTVLAGHGVLTAVRKMGLTRVSAKRMDLDPFDSRALKILAGDNEISKLAEVDDRALSEILKEIKDADPSGLAGTGFDEKMLANLVYVTRPASEIKDFDEAAHWVGMPEFDSGSEPVKCVISFETEEDRERFMDVIGASVVKKATGKVWSFWWPEREKEDLASVRFEG